MKNIGLLKKVLLLVLSSSMVTLTTGCAAKNVNFKNVIRDTPIGAFANDKTSRSIIRTYQNEDGDYYPERISELKSLVLKKQGSFDSSFDDAQDERVQSVAKDIISKLKSGQSNSTRPLIILIHGFNVENAEPSYAFARDTINAYLSNKISPVYWQVNWDGRVIKWNKLWYAWSRAQGTGPLVGLKMRRVLNKVLEEMPNTPVRIMTHSSGAFIAASLLGNNSNALSLAKTCTGNYALFCNHVRNDTAIGEYRVPQSNDMRLLVLAPATPPNSFALEGSIDEGLLTRKLTFIMGIDKDDVAVSKSILPASASFFGSTSLGANINDARELKDLIGTFNEIKKRPIKIETHVVDFSRSSTYNERSMFFWDSHDFDVYLRRSGMMKALPLFLDTLKVH